VPDELYKYRADIDLASMQAQMAAIQGQMGGQLAQMVQPVTQAMNFTYASGIQGMQQAQDFAYRQNAMSGMGPGGSPFRISHALGETPGFLGTFAGAAGMRPTASFMMNPLELQASFAQEAARRVEDTAIGAAQGAGSFVGSLGGMAAGFGAGNWLGNRLAANLIPGGSIGSSIAGAAYGLISGQGMMGAAFGAMGGLGAAVGTSGAGIGQGLGSSLYGPSGLGTLGSLLGAFSPIPGGAMIGGALGSLVGGVAQTGMETFVRGRELQSMAEQIGMTAARGPDSRSPFGIGYNKGQSREIASGIQNMAAGDIRFGQDDYRDIIQASARYGAFDTAGTVSKFKDKVKEQIESVKLIQTALHKTVQESTQVMEQFFEMGVIDKNKIQQMTMATRTGAYQSGVSMDTILQAQRAGAQMAIGTSVAPALAGDIAMQGVVSLRRMRHMDAFRNKVTGEDMTEQIIAGAGGEAAAGQLLGQSGAQYAGSGAMRTLLAAAYDPKTRGLNEDIIRRRMSGQIDQAELSMMAANLTGDREATNRFQFDRPQLLANMFGSETAAAAAVQGLEYAQVREITERKGLGFNVENVAGYYRTKGYAEPQAMIQAQNLMDAPQRLQEQVKTARSDMRQTTMSDMARLVGPMAFVHRGMVGIGKTLTAVATGAGDAYEEYVKNPLRGTYYKNYLGMPSDLFEPAMEFSDSALLASTFYQPSVNATAKLARERQDREVGVSVSDREFHLLDVSGATANERLKATVAGRAGGDNIVGLGQVVKYSAALAEARQKSLGGDERLIRTSEADDMGVSFYLHTSDKLLNAVPGSNDRVLGMLKNEPLGQEAYMAAKVMVAEKFKAAPGLLAAAVADYVAYTDVGGMFSHSSEAASKTSPIANFVDRKLSGFTAAQRADPYVQATIMNEIITQADAEGLRNKKEGVAQMSTPGGAFAAAQAGDALRKSDKELEDVLMGRGFAHGFARDLTHGTAAVGGLAVAAKIAKASWALPGPLKVLGVLGGLAAGVGVGGATEVGGTAFIGGTEALEQDGLGAALWRIGAATASGGAGGVVLGGLVAAPAAAAATVGSWGAALGPAAIGVAISAAGGGLLGAKSGFAVQAGVELARWGWGRPAGGLSKEAAKAMSEDHTPETTKALEFVRSKKQTSDETISVQDVMDSMQFPASYSPQTQEQREAFATALKSAKLVVGTQNEVAGLSDEYMDARSNMIGIATSNKKNERINEAFTTIADRAGGDTAKNIKEGMEAVHKDTQKTGDLLSAMLAGDAEKFKDASGISLTTGELAKESRAFFKQSPTMEAMLKSTDKLSDALGVEDKEQRLKTVEGIYKGIGFTGAQATARAEGLIAGEDKSWDAGKGKHLDKSTIMGHQAYLGSASAGSSAPSNQALAGAITAFPKMIGDAIRDIATMSKHLEAVAGKLKT